MPLWAYAWAQSYVLAVTAASTERPAWQPMLKTRRLTSAPVFPAGFVVASKGRLPDVKYGGTTAGGANSKWSACPFREVIDGAEPPVGRKASRSVCCVQSATAVAIGLGNVFAPVVKRLANGASISAAPSCMKSYPVVNEIGRASCRGRGE